MSGSECMKGSKDCIKLTEKRKVPCGICRPPWHKDANKHGIDHLEFDSGICKTLNAIDRSLGFKVSR